MAVRLSAAGGNRQQQAAVDSSRQQQAATGSNRQQQAATGSNRQQQAATGSEGMVCNSSIYVSTGRSDQLGQI